MPQEIIPVHKLEQPGSFFEDKYEGQGLSHLQQQFLGVKSAAKTTFSEHTLKMLEEITKHEDEVLSATEAVVVTANTDQKPNLVFRVPTTIPDYDLLALKTQGLVQGRDRAVKLTDLGRVALRDYWLKSSNALLEGRTKTRFELERIAGVIEAEPDKENRKFARVNQED